MDFSVFKGSWNLQKKLSRNLVRCQLCPNQCLIAPDNLKKGANIEQAFVTDKWIKMFSDIRKMPGKYWADYKQLYIIPLQDIYKASRPGISQSEEKRMIQKTEKLFEKKRKMDDIDFELQKKISADILVPCLSLTFSKKKRIHLCAVTRRQYFYCFPVTVVCINLC